MKSLTVAEVMALKPCYSKARVTELWAGRESLTLREIAALDIPLSDRLWVALAPGVLPAPVLGELHCRIVDEAVAIYEKYYPDDPRPHHANEVHRAMLRGEATEEEWAAARYAARAAARAAAWFAARYAAWAAASAAASDAARAAASDAASDAASAAALTRYLEWAVEAAEVAE